MRGLKYKIITVLAVFVMPFCAEVSGQSFNTLNPGMGDFNDMNFQTPGGIGANPFQTEEGPLDSARMDTTKKERKPLESYFFNDSIRSQNNFAWNINMSMNRIEMTRIDTILYDFQVDYPFLKKDVGDAYLGNLGAPSIPLGFYDRPQFRDFQMAQPLYSYLYTPESAPFYNVKKPLTQLGYITAGQRQYAEENISILHAQNITPSTGFNVTYHTMGTRGIYMNQATRDTDFSFGVSHNGKRYTGYAGYIFNTIRMQENGGVVDDWYITGVKKERPFEIPFMLSDARNILKNNTFYTFHSYGIPLRRLTDDDFSMAGVPAIYVGYSLQYDSWNRVYTDTYSGMQTPSKDGGSADAPVPTTPFYEHWYFNGTASRETEAMAVEMIRRLGGGVSYMIVNEAGASVYSASKLAAEEFPQYDVNLRSAVSIARRLQDPLAELVKIDPKAIGVGQYQHDMPEKELDAALGGVVEACVNAVGVDLNTASAPLLRQVAGLNATTAKNIVAYREENGAFTSRAQIKKVPKLGPKAFEQCAGFLRVPESAKVLDHTGVHPESYKAAEELLTRCGLKLMDVGTQKLQELPARVKLYGEQKLAGDCQIGVPTMLDIVKELVKPGRDPRDELPAPILRTDVLELKDLKPGMELSGTVRNVIDFGVFVDIGVHQDGLVHISQVCSKFIKHPSEVVSVGDVVKVRVLEVDEKRKRISLTMKDV